MLHVVYSDLNVDWEMLSFENVNEIDFLHSKPKPQMFFQETF